MAATEVTINGRAYRVACDDGQERHLAHLAEAVNQRIRPMMAGAPQLTETMALVLASLMMADEVHDLRVELRDMKARIDVARGAPAGSAETEQAMAATLHHIAERIEAIAEYVEMK